MDGFGIYVHIPYCLTKCPYCDFNSYAQASIPERDYLAAILAELNFRAQSEPWRGRTVKSIYFGGGTPSLFSPFAIQRIITSVFKQLAVAELVEITLEANPGTLAVDKLEGFREAGVNRLSIGAQSFRQQTLSILGRIHTPAQTQSAVAAARAADFNNLNLDLIYAVPEQSVAHLQADLTDLLSLNPEHVSAYGLTVEKGTPFFKSCKQGELILPSEELSTEMFEIVRRTLVAHGYQHYEISNFAKPGRAARHNCAYWDGTDYLGLGAGAHSYCRNTEEAQQFFGVRWSNYAHPDRYIKQAGAGGNCEAWRDKLSWADAVFEFFFLGLRRIQGVDLSVFKQRFGLPVEEVYPALLQVLTSEGLLRREQERLALSAKALLVADTVIANFSALECDGSHTAQIKRRPPPTETTAQPARLGSTSTGGF